MPTPQEEFEEIALPHLRSLFRVARRLTLNPSSAEDAVQETYLLAWRSFHRFQRGTNARAWLFRILLNSIYAQRRKSRRAPEVLPLPEAEPADITSGNRSSLLATVEVGSALRRLSVEHRSVLLLAVVEGFTCEEIAGILGVPIGTVMSRLSRAREALRGQLSPRSAGSHAKAVKTLYARREGI